MDDMATMISGLSGFLDDKDIVTDRDDMAPFLTDWRGIFTGSAQAIVFPR